MSRKIFGVSLCLFSKNTLGEDMPYLPGMARFVSEDDCEEGVDEDTHPHFRLDGEDWCSERRCKRRQSRRPSEKAAAPIVQVPWPCILRGRGPTGNRV